MTWGVSGVKLSLALGAEEGFFKTAFQAFFQFINTYHIGSTSIEVLYLNREEQ
jgi:hypothetical protein